MGQRSHLHVIIWILVFAFAVLADGTTHAFVRSEEELMRAEVENARVRARDFQHYRERAAAMEKKRESAAYERKIERAEEDAEQEATRQAYLVERSKRHMKEADLERLEREDEVKRLEGLKVMDQARRAYLRKRAEVKATIERDGWIDETEEYDLKYPTPSASQDHHGLKN